jgi:hypothetical protein
MEIQTRGGAKVWTELQMEASFYFFSNNHIWGSNDWVLACFFSWIDNHVKNALHKKIVKKL